MRKPRVTVWYSAYATWMVGIEGPLWMPPGEWRTVIVATWETRDAANAYAKGLRKGLRGDSR